MNLKRCLSVLLLLLAAMIRPSYGTLYSLIPDDGLTGGYGFSGTVTTDGSVGVFSDASAITDWSITLSTPGGVDGVTSQLLTPSTSSVLLALQGAGLLNITSSEMTIANSGTTLTTNLFFIPVTNELLSFEGPIAMGLSGFASVSDVAENPPFSFFLLGDSTSASFAFAVPEPGALYFGLLAAGVLGMVAGRSRRSRSFVKENHAASGDLR